MTKTELWTFFKVYTDEITRCKSGGCYWSMTHMVLSLPDICNTLEVNRPKKNRDAGIGYTNWCSDYLSKYDSLIKPEEWWEVRNKILHQGYTLSEKRYAGYVFHPPGKCAHKNVDVAKKMHLDVIKLADEILRGMDRWMDDVLTSPKRLAQVQIYLKDLVWEDPSSGAASVYRTNIASIPISGTPFPPIITRNTTQSP